MMELPATFSKSSFPEKYAAWMATITSCEEYVLRNKSLQIIGLPIHTTRAYVTTANAPANPTITYQFMVFQRITYYEEYLLDAEDTSGLGVSSDFLLDLSSREATETHIRTRHGISGVLCDTLGYPEVQLRYELVTPPESLWISTQVIREEEEQEIIRADTNRAMSFMELLDALNRISHPMEMEDIPLSVDPDDFPVV